MSEKTEREKGMGTRIPLWLIVFSMIVAMVFVSPYEYSWSLFTAPLGKLFGVRPTGYIISTTFSIYIIVQALTMFFSGRYLDRRRHLTPYFVVIAGVLTSLGWILSSFTSKSTGIYYLYAMYGIGSLGPGIVYGVGISTALKWFRGKTRGLVVGLIDLGFGAGSFGVSPLVEYLIKNYNFHVAFFDVGLLMLIIVPFGFLVRYPPPDYVPYGKTAAEADVVRKRVKKSGLQDSPRQMVSRWQFWAIYIGFFFSAGAYLGIVGKLPSIGTTVTGVAIAGFIAVYVFPISNGIGRFVSGVVSDFIGRREAILLFYGISGIGLLILFLMKSPIAFVITIMIIAFCSGPLFTLWPSMVGDYFGEQKSGANYGVVYTAKAVAGLFAGYGFAIYYTDYGVHNSLLLTGTMMIIAALIGFGTVVPKVKQHVGVTKTVPANSQ